MCLGHVEGVLVKFYNLLHGLATVYVYMLFSATKLILSEMAANG